MIYFSSDFHINHQNIAGPKVSKWHSGYRNFDSVEEMDRTIIGNINSKVGEDDILYFLGDFTFKGKETAKSICNKLKVKTIHFVKGNHDKQTDKNAYLFTSMQDVIHTTIEGQEIFMSHYAHRVWPNMHRGSWCLYGHSHASIEGEAWGLSMDVGIDNYYRLFGTYDVFSFEEIKEIMESRVIKTDLIV